MTITNLLCPKKWLDQPDPNYRWQRVNDEPFEYAIVRGDLGDGFVRMLDGSFLRRPITPTN